MDIDVEQHGDDFFCESERDNNLWLKAQFERDFWCKKAVVVSPNPADEKERSFLHRKVWVDEQGWHEELDPKYLDDMVQQAGLENSHPQKTPGTKEGKKTGQSVRLDAGEHSQYRSIGGLAQYITDRRGDINFSCKEVLRHSHAPEKQDETKIKRMARYLKGHPRCVQHFKWITKLPDTIEVYEDSDWTGEEDTRKSTSGGAAVLANTELKHWCATQGTISLSSGEAETKAAVKALIEGLYIQNLLRQQGLDLHLVIHSDSSAAIGHCARLGNGKRMRHLEGAELWIQQVLRSGKATMKKINGKVNPADVFTKYLPEADIIRHMSVLGFEIFNDKRVSFDSKKFDEKFEECDGDWDLVAESENRDEDMSVALIRHAASL